MQGAGILASIHRANYCETATKMIALFFRRPEGRTTCKRTFVGKIYEEYIERLSPTANTRRFFEEPERILRSRLLVLKSPKPNEKGVIVVDYSFALPILLRFFDVNKIATKYYLVLEPSWSGYCDLDLLCYAKYDFPVFVQAFEPRDAAFIEYTRSNLIAVPTSTNWWVDHRVMKPCPGVSKDVDAIMVASWARFKRHHQIFLALGRLRRRGIGLKVVLVGYPTDCTRDDIFRLARYFDVDKQLELYEWLSPEQVNQHLNRAKVNLVWSRKEGVNRAIIEGMFAGVPCILREGFNYGYDYPYINGKTGCFSAEDDLPDRLCWMIENYQLFSPRDWASENMSCQQATKIIRDAIRRKALETGEVWTEDLAVKVCHLNTMRYWDGADMLKYNADYLYLQSTAKRQPF